ncbi:MAG: hypothetical protein MR270_06050 [Erysipelotrichaceae bacterium]|nr:hypothetical protein [Erysipelotrichaceae bacterium]
MKTYDYYCTWQAQNLLCQTKGVSNRDYLDEKAIFGENGLVNAYEGFRQDLYFILDDGWDVPYSYNVKEDYPFASHIIKNDRFPSFKGKPQEKLKQMVDKIMSYGWKGVGIWVCAQGSGNAYKRSIKGLKSFFKKRLEWSKYANVSYWKVDWGIYCNEVSFRKMLTKLANEIYPELIIENAMCIGPVNGFESGEEENLKYDFPWNKEMKKYIDKVTDFSEVFRSYDVTEELSTNSTLNRVSYLLKQQKCVINCEDELYLGVILGMALGIERNKMCVVKNITPDTSFHNKENETIAALRYRRISPSYVGGKIHVSKEKFLDSYKFGQYWCDNVTNHEVKQLCPSIVSRNTSLPKVKKVKEQPYVVAGKDFNNNYAIGTFKRINFEDDDKYEVDVSFKIDSEVNNVAIFSNHIRVLRISFANDMKNKKFILSDLINNTNFDISDMIKVKDNKVTINYQKLTKNFTCDDLSSKAYLLSIK